MSLLMIIPIKDERKGRKGKRKGERRERRERRERGERGEREEREERVLNDVLKNGTYSFNQSLDRQTSFELGFECETFGVILADCTFLLSPQNNLGRCVASVLAQNPQSV